MSRPGKMSFLMNALWASKAPQALALMVVYLAICNAASLVFRTVCDSSTYTHTLYHIRAGDGYDGSMAAFFIAMGIQLVAFVAWFWARHQLKDYPSTGDDP